MEGLLRLYGTELMRIIYVLNLHGFEEAGQAVPDLEISMYSEIPLTRGLGKCFGDCVANALIGSPRGFQAFDMATNLEKHPDNVGAFIWRDYYGCMGRNSCGLYTY